MKRKPIFFALSLLIVVGAALWGFNYWLNHPPLSAADREFHSLVADAVSVNASQGSCQTGECLKNAIISYKPFDAEQTRELIEQLRFVDSAPATTNRTTTMGISTELTLAFRNAKGEFLFFTLYQTPQESALIQPTISPNQHWGSQWGAQRAQLSPYYISPRFNKRLNRTLDAYLPQRIRP